MKTLRPHQAKAVNELKNGSVLVGTTGSGKTLVALTYYYEKILGGSYDSPKITNPVDLIVITTAKKRDTLDFQKEASQFLITEGYNELYGIRFSVDSWNNIKKYREVKNSFFIFDEQRVVSSGVWTRSFVKIARQNKWILLSATPADTWLDLVGVFVANGFYKNTTMFKAEHVIYSPHTTYPKVIGYRDEQKLSYLRDKIFVVMDFSNPITKKVLDVVVDYNKEAHDKLFNTLWSPITDTPIRNRSEFEYCERWVLGRDSGRLVKLKEILKKHKRVIVFYNFNFELNDIKDYFKDLVDVSEYNGNRHDTIPESDSWLYLVQYISGSEAWECFTTNAIVFYSLNYSYRIMKQAMGRINRLTTTFKVLYYYRFYTDSDLDKSILSHLNKKKKFNYSHFRNILEI